MTKFKIRWAYANLLQRSAEEVERIKQLYFEDAARQWGYVLRGWPDGLRLPDDSPFTELTIEVSFEAFTGEDAEAIARVPADGIRRTAVSDSQPKPFPYQAEMLIDLKDFDRLLEDRERFFDTIVHEIGHVLGIGTSWERQGGGAALVDVDEQARTAAAAAVKEAKDAKAKAAGPVAVKGTKVAMYIGQHARAGYGTVKGVSGSPKIPLDTEYMDSTRAFHWSEEELRYEIMSTRLDDPKVGRGKIGGSNVISAVSVGALEDLGYVVNMSAAQALSLP
ncbi:hypothetical protein [Variovorax guangxiensis]|uniref:hypothetical protein n=1 Tax=Variovorax guangxiensis TaxID=1775474 RepID=UPI002860A43E|nr:hypothetical protein [Variovorax guangxiensis]MDR6859866.1 hypothetical protein [Variovorax guangxiensis]